ncbi:hypothetical protein GQX73_g4902 [Xylaria multiplex]|uniref:Uncharacterized protein n=1 Tax=Xylaria multiplex TaxID=323545 RepID=A0A7C8MQ80_9PEZI|nr:hypothetical protein GQX73_g4902 [Xylaria multiplex]
MPRPGSPDSYASVLSDDSYLALLKPGLDDIFKEVLNDIKILEDNRRSILKERKIQSHEAKRRDPTDLDTERDWTPQMELDYESYKAKGEVLKSVKAAQKASASAVDNNRSSDLATLEALHNTALEDAETWQRVAMEAAVERLNFMKKYPNAFNTPSTKTHIKAAEDTLNSAKLAQREIQTRKKKIAQVKLIEEKRAGGSSRHAK